MELSGSNCKDLSFDYIIIGSSPVMLLQAISLAEIGHRVCVLERESQLGGAWQIYPLRPDLHVEIACHVIEVFPHVYEYLSDIVEVPFITLQNQPIRVHNLGFRIRYSSRLLVLVAGIRLFLGFIVASFTVNVLRRNNKNNLLNFKSKLKSFWLYQRSIIFGESIMKGPKFGFVDFINRLIKKCETRGVKFLTFDVNLVNRVNDQWLVSDKAGNVLSSKYVNSTSSTNLRHVKPGKFESTDYKLTPRYSVLISIHKSSIFKNQSYVAFWKDPYVTRISRIDHIKYDIDQVCFLVEIKSSKKIKSDELNTILRKSLEKSAIITRGAFFDNLGAIDCFYTENEGQLTEGDIDDGFTCFYSFGNLAAGIARWLELKKESN